MVKTTQGARLVAGIGLALGSCLFGAVAPVRALTTSDRPAAIVIWPKIVVDTAGKFGDPTDTVLQLSNTSRREAKEAHCFLINANSHCANNPALVCQSSADCIAGNATAACVPGWSEVDFGVILTADQPLGWHASQGLQRDDFPLQVPGVCTNPPIAGRLCSSDAQCGGGPGSCRITQSNVGGGIPAVPEDPFVGSLKCIQFALTNPPAPDQGASSNSLKGEATIETAFASAPAPSIDVAKYNAVGVGFNAPEAGIPPDELHLDGAQYQTCPTTLLLNFFFEGGVSSAGDLTLVPCGDDFLDQIPGKVTAQFVVFNEFEQRFSTSRLVDCFFESRLGNIDTPNALRSIFSFNVGGTLQGQARIRGVGNAATGRGLVGVARTFVGPGSAAYDLYEDGTPSVPNADVITLP